MSKLYNLKDTRIAGKSFPKSEFEVEGILVMNPYVYAYEGVPQPMNPLFWAEWQFDLELISGQTQNGLCICGQGLYGFDIDLHHAIITKRDVMGVDKVVKPYILHHSYNVVVVHTLCHAKVNRQDSWNFQCRLYGEPNVRKWYEGLPLKKLPRRF